MMQVTEQHRDWMRHSVQLCRDRVRNVDFWMAHGAMSLSQRNDLTTELAYREKVLLLLNRPSALFMDDRVATWFWFMFAHAELQIARYADEIDDTQFHNRARSLRQGRDDALSQMRLAA